MRKNVVGWVGRISFCVIWECQGSAISVYRLLLDGCEIGKSGEMAAMRNIAFTR